MFFKRFLRLGQIVFATHRQQHAALLERGDVFLERLKRLAARRGVAQFDAFQTVVRHHAAPKRVVEIQHEHFFRRTFERENQMRHFAREFHQQRRRARLLALEPGPLVARRETTKAVSDERPIADVQIRRGREAEFEIDPLAEGPVRAERARAERAKVVPRGEHEIGGGDFRAGLFVHLAGKLQQRIYGALRFGLHKLARVGELAGVNAAALRR